ncbi:MAG: carbonic anhydrase family protein [Giesbergeria sp.]|uniref:carbonic anhydrase family protein n=1 Tax=Giesbergeria sp. TaxID=2818473 RepID=UPI0026135A69|nr:carbonic anhydrase family protein [Giesbergeria sp.]MDD2610412.1 carbonic anhydrase family protein [Giesbergeria sp.]
MNPTPVSFLPILRRCGSASAVLAGLLLGQTVRAAEPAPEPAAKTAPTPAPAAPAAPAPLRLSNPEERALLIERINEVIERTNQKYASPSRRSSRAGRGKRKAEPPTIPTFAVELGRPTSRPASKKTSKRTHKKPTAVAATAAAAATSAAAAVPALDETTAPPAPPLNTLAPSAAPTSSTATPVVAPAPEMAVATPSASRRYIAERAALLAATVPAQNAAASLTSPLAPFSLEPSTPQAAWSYAGATGPQAWGQLHPSFALCGSGQRQSPIEWSAPPDKTGPTAHLPLGNQVFTGVLEHTGRFLQLQVQGLSTLDLRGMEWELQRIQLHYPAEERIGSTDEVVMAVDLLYRAPTQQWAVVSVPLQLGAANPFLAQLWAYLPLHAGERVTLTPGQLQLHDLLPAQRQYYQYLGSFTQPPCTEGVLRLVLKNPASIAPEQLQRLMALLPPHARPVQPLYGRQVLLGP